MKIVFFDGYCSLCNALIDWLVRVDRSGQLRFASLQGETARQRLGEKHGAIDIDTVIYLRGDEKFERSTAILQILSDVGGLWSLTRIFLAVPKFLRDAVYRLIGRNRYRFWKKRETCRLPTPEERSRFLP